MIQAQKIGTADQHRLFLRGKLRKFFAQTRAHHFRIFPCEERIGVPAAKELERAFGGFKVQRILRKRFPPVAVVGDPDLARVSALAEFPHGTPVSQKQIVRGDVRQPGVPDPRREDVESVAEDGGTP